MPTPTVTAVDIPERRLRSSRVTGPPLGSAAEVVGWLGAVQSQDYAGAKWAIGLRTAGVTDADIDQLFNDGAILRTHLLRPTWHFVLPADIHWMLRLSRPRVKAALAYYDRILEVDEALITRSNTMLSGGLQGGVRMVRPELTRLYRRHGISAEGQRLGHLLMHAELDGVVCSGGLRGRQFTYALLDPTGGEAESPTGEAALAELAARYFAGHGPAQLEDFAWWSGLTIRQARRATELAASGLHSAVVGGARYHWAAASVPRGGRRVPAHILPNFDEYLVGYTDRTLHIDGAVSATQRARGDLLANSIVVDGRIVGGWRRTVAAHAVTVSARLRMALSDAQRAAVERSCRRYGLFLGQPVRLVWEAA